MSKKLWGGRFSKNTDPLVEEFTRSVHYDKKLAKYDIFASMAHVQVLKKAGYLKAAEAGRLTRALGALYRLAASGAYRVDTGSEDIHTDIQNKLQKAVGDVALKLHTARSRNDQVVLSTKVYCKTELACIGAALTKLEYALGSLGAQNREMILPGFTHMQHAQPIYLKDYLGAYVEMFRRDAERVRGISDRIELAMGAGALAGTPIGSEKYYVKIPGLSIKAVANSIDAVSDRDFVVEALSAIAIIGMHLSRLSEDLIIWSTEEFDFAEIDEAFCTGSSLMPQKKNADVLEMVRGYAGRLYGNLVSVLVTMKGLPLAYNRDMQLDKEPLFGSVEVIQDELRLMAGLIGTLRFNKAKIEERLEDESLYATDLVYYLVGKGVAFKTAHTIVGRLVKYAIDNSIEIKSMTDRELGRFSGKFNRKDLLRLFNPRVSVQSKRSVKRR
jgi:argininosuccinate lyase